MVAATLARKALTKGTQAARRAAAAAKKKAAKKAREATKTVKKKAKTAKKKARKTSNVKHQTMGKILGMLAEAGVQTATNAAQTGLGMLLSGWNDRRQLKQQQKLQDQQIAGNKELLEAQRLKEMQMWEDTNYSAQKEQMRKAGLNPALMYGMGGGGGTTVGGGGGAVSAGEAPKGGREIPGS